MRSGFHYGDPAKPDWDADIKWSFLSHDGTSDLYRVEVAFRTKFGNSRPHVIEVPFDGSQPAMIPINDWLVISVEPTRSVEQS
jgi:hypothetical protein